MCGRITRKSPPNQLGLSIVSAVEPLYVPPRYNGAPGQEQWVIRQQPKTSERTLDRLWWGLIPHWCKDADGGRKPINAKAETVASLPTFREAYKRALRTGKATPAQIRSMAGRIESERAAVAKRSKKK